MLSRVLKSCSRWPVGLVSCVYKRAETSMLVHWSGEEKKHSSTQLDYTFNFTISRDTRHIFLSLIIPRSQSRQAANSNSQDVVKM